MSEWCECTYRRCPVYFFLGSVCICFFFFFVILTLNRRYFHREHLPFRVCNGDAVCLLLRRKWNFVYYLDALQVQTGLEEEGHKVNGYSEFVSGHKRVKLSNGEC